MEKLEQETVLEFKKKKNCYLNVIFQSKQTKIALTKWTQEVCFPSDLLKQFLKECWG